MKAALLLPTTVTRKLCLYIGAAVSSVLLVVNLWAWPPLKAALVERTDLAAQKLTESLVGDLDKFVLRVSALPEHLAIRQRMHGRVPDPGLPDALADVLRDTPASEVYAAYVVYHEPAPDGGVVERWVDRNSFPRLAAKGVRRLDPDWDWYFGALKRRDGCHITEPAWNRENSGAATFTVSRAVRDPAGSTIAVAAVDISLEEVRRLVNAIRLQAERDGVFAPGGAVGDERGGGRLLPQDADYGGLRIGDMFAYLVSPRGIVIAHPEPAHELGPAGQEARLESLPEGRMVASSPGGFGEIEGAGGSRRLYWARSPQTGWTLVLNVSTEAAMAPLAGHTMRRLVMMPLALASIVAVIYLVARRIIRPLAVLTEVAAAAEDGRYSDRRLVGVTRSNDEIGRLAKAFRAMIQQVAAREERLRKAEEEIRLSERKFRSLIENAAEFVTVFAADGTILYESPSAEKALGFPAGEVVGKRLGNRIHPDDLKHVQARFACVLNRPAVTETVRFRARHKEGGWRIIESVAINLLDDPAVGGVVANNRDITSRVQAEEVQARLAAVVRQSPDFIGMADMNGVQFFVNPAGRALVGLEEGEAVGLDIRRVHPEQTWQFMQAEVLPVLHKRGFWEGELKLLHTKTGRVIDVHSRHFIVPDPVTGRPLCMAAVMRDITERRRAESERLRLAELVARSSDFIGLADIDGRAVFLNDAGRKLVGYDCGTECSSIVFRDFVHRESRDRLDREVMPMVKAGGRWEGELSLQNLRTGRPVEVAANIFLISDPAGGQTWMAGVLRDITDRRLAESLERRRRAAEAANRAKSEFLANMSHELRTPMNGIIGMTELALDTDLSPEQREYLTLVRTSADALLGLLNDILDFSKIEAGKLDLERVPFALRDSLGDTMQTLAVRAHQKGIELAYHVDADVPDRLVGDPGRVRQILVNLAGNAIKFTESGEVVVGLSLASQDEVARLEAAAAAHPASHGAANPAGHGAANPAGHGPAGAHTGAGKGHDPLGDSRFGGRPPFPAGAHQAGTAGGPQAGGSASDSGTRMLPMTPSGAALPASPTGSGIRPRPRDVYLHFRVSDTGIGIAADKLDMIFRPFEQADTSTTRRYGGTGLGLSISRQLVEMMGGRIWVESEVGRGSTFHFVIRAGLAGETRRPAEAEELGGLPVLVVDDNATNRRILHDVLTNWRMKPVVVDGVAPAMERLRAARTAGDPFRLVLTDLNMPEEDGLDLVRHMRDDPAFQRVPVLLLSSSGPSGDPGRMREADLAGILIKPVKQSSLLDAILGAVGGPRSSDGADRGAVAGARPALPDVTPLRVLLVEDTPVNQKMATRLLEKHGHRVVLAVNGRQAVDAAARERFDVVLMDVQMPEMDGFEATAAIRKAEHRAPRPPVPIVAMTAHAMKGDRERCLAAGMNDYVSKPIVAAELFKVLAGIPVVVGADGTGRRESAPALPHDVRPDALPGAGTGAGSGTGSATTSTGGGTVAGTVAGTGAPGAPAATVPAAETTRAERQPGGQPLPPAALAAPFPVLPVGSGDTIAETLADNAAAAAAGHDGHDGHDGSAPGGELEDGQTVFDVPAEPGAGEGTAAGTGTPPRAGNGSAASADASGFASADATGFASADATGFASADATGFPSADGSSGSGSPVPPEPAGGSAGARPAVDVKRMLDRVDGDREFARELADIFRGEYPGQLAKAADALLAGDRKALERLAHALKGTLGNFAADAAAEAALAVEKRAAADPPEVLGRLLEDLGRRVRRVDAELADLLAGGAGAGPVPTPVPAGSTA